MCTLWVYVMGYVKLNFQAQCFGARSYPTDVDNVYVDFRKPSLIWNSWIAHRHLTINNTLFSQCYIGQCSIFATFSDPHSHGPKNKSKNPYQLRNHIIPNHCRTRNHETCGPNGCQLGIMWFRNGYGFLLYYPPSSVKVNLIPVAFAILNWCSWCAPALWAIC